MTETFLSSLQILKLGHNIKEIRERALQNVISKLEFSPLHEKDFGLIKEILLKLFGWFALTPLSYEDAVLKLIKRILESQHGPNLMHFYTDKMLVNELINIGKVVSKTCHTLLDDIVNIIDANKMDTVPYVPQLESREPLSSRITNEGGAGDSVGIGSTATTIQAQVQKSPSLLLGLGDLADSDRTSYISGGATSTRTEAPRVRYYTLPWQPLVGPDCHVLESVEESLRNPSQAIALMQSCEFFNEVLLQDFPAEVFLQRPAIIMLFQHLLSTCKSSRITTGALGCLNKLTQCLKTRMHFFSDPNTHNLKLHTFMSSSLPSPASTASTVINYPMEDISFLKSKQLPIPQFCLSTINCVLNYLYVKPTSVIITNGNVRPVRKICQVGINISLVLLRELINVLKLCCFTSEIWQTDSSSNSNSIIKEIVQMFQECLIKYGDLLENFRLDLISNHNQSKRITYLHLMANMTALLTDILPSDHQFPKYLKTALSSTILDASILRLYPKMHQHILEIVKKFDGRCEADSCSKYEDIKSILDSMSNAIKFLQTNSNELTLCESIQLVTKGLKSLEFHRDFSFMYKFLDLCSSRFSLSYYDEEVFQSIDYIIQALLAHADKEIQSNMYKTCQKIVVATIGVKFCSTTEPGSQILFLLRPVVLQEIIMHGLSSENEVIADCANDILIHLLKCQILTSPTIWQKTVEVLIPNINLLLWYTSNTSSLSRTLMSILDPDQAEKLHIPIEQVLTGNCCLLFSHNASFRAEAVSRICWLLSVDLSSAKLLPKLNNLHDKSLAHICQVSRKHDLNKTKNNQHFYQASSLHQVMDLLTSTATVEPVIRRSALIQVSVMTEDPLLHVAFQERGGVAAMISAMRNALTECNYAEYPDSVLPILATLKNVCLYSVAAREQLSSNVEVIGFIIRGLVLFCTDDRAKQDGSILLFLLLFNGVVTGSPNQHDLSLPQLIMDKLNAPFSCKVYTRSCLITLADAFLTDKWCLSALRIHWNSEWFGGFKEVLNWDRISYGAIPFNDTLKLTQSDLDGLKYASLEFCIRENLKEISIASSHENVQNAIHLLNNCISLYGLMKNDYISQTDITKFNWKEFLGKFIESRPGGNEDSILLTHVINVLALLTPIYKTSDNICWISMILKDKLHCLSDMLDAEFSDDLDSKKISQALLKLMTICASNEQSFLGLYTLASADCSSSDWNHLIVQLVDYLKFNNTQHFYNLAYLDSLLCCLVQLTVTLGWSKNNGVQSKQLLSKLLSGLCELLEAFHSGKGSCVSSSLMGMSITKNILMILNHMLVEVQHFNTHDWEDCFLDNLLNWEIIPTDFISLLSNRDVFIRAAVVQLFSGFSLSLKLAIKLIQNFRHNHLGFWETFLAIMLDHEEASIVRENSAALLSNIIYHSVQNREDKEIIEKLLPLHTNNSSAVKFLINFLEENRFYKEIELILNCLYVESDFNYDCLNIDSKGNSPRILSNKKDEYIFAYTKNIPIMMRSVSSIGSSTNRPILTTPGFVKNLTHFVNQLLQLASAEISDILQENNIIKIFLRCIIVPTTEIQNTKHLAAYCEIIFMNKSIINAISSAVHASSACKQAVLHTRDCLHILITLLNPNVYCVELDRLLQLRNDLWLEIYKLLTNVLQTNADDKNTKSLECVNNVIISVIEECGFGMFVESLCDSIGRHNLPSLQQSALAVLIGLLRISSSISENSKSAMRNLFDTTVSPTKYDLTLQLDNESSPNKEKMQMTLLENIYFGKVAANLRTPRVQNEGGNVKVGAELCKILIRLHELHTIRNMNKSKLKYILINTLAGVLCVSLEAKRYAFENDFMLVAIQQVKDIYIKISLESVSSIRKVADKRRLQPILKEMAAIFGLITNFMMEKTEIKRQVSVAGLADLVHKLWTWCITQSELIIDVLKMLCTFTTHCAEACQSLTTTSSVLGIGPRKQPNVSCLLNVIVNQIGKEMDLISQTHNLAAMQLCFHLLQNSCEVTECRNVIVKSNLLQFIGRLHPAITKRQKSYENIELIWLNFLLVFTGYVEGQSCVTKIPDAFEFLIAMTNSSLKTENKLPALMALRNLVFYSPNRPRLLNYDDFLTILDLKLTFGSLEEQYIVAIIIWSLAANNQKAKLIFKVAKLDVKLLEAIKVVQMSEDVRDDVSSDYLNQMYQVFYLIRTGGSNRSF